MILAIGEWALSTACAQLKKWDVDGRYNLSVAVNLSARQFHQQNIIQLVKSVLNETGLNPECLEIELTESTLMQRGEVVDRTLQQLKSIGVKLSLDDFGVGYSSLSYVKRLPIDTLKIDKSFIDDITHSTTDAAIVKVILDMARALKVRTVAEGVETQGQVDFLLANNCNAIQGYYFSHPLSVDELTALLQAGKALPVENWITGTKEKHSKWATRRSKADLVPK